MQGLTIETELYGFSDASERAFAAVVYIRERIEDGSYYIALISAKTKVAPLKLVSLPRLELCAAVLLARLARYVQAILNISGAPLYLWSDSTVTLGWIKGHPTRWKPYVANKVSEIQTTVPETTWHHIPGEDNPVDCVS